MLGTGGGEQGSVGGVGERVAAPAPDWLVDGGELGALIRAFDWSCTPVGARETWPPSLRTVVNLVVSTRFPMALLWGPELVLIYNDAYRDIAGERHPAALGRSSREAWPEVWYINAPILEAVMVRGETLSFEDKPYPIDRRGVRQDAYFTICYSPVRQERGAVGGALVTLQETTAQVVDRTAREEALRVALRAADEEHQRLVAVLEALPAGVAIADPSGKVVLFNEALTRIWGAPPVPKSTGEYAEWRAWWPDTGEPLAAADWAMARALATGKTVPGDVVEIEPFDGSGRKTILNAAAPIFGAGGQVVGGVVAEIDLTAQRRAEEALREADRRKDEFLGALSHELRNPLAPIRTSLFILDRAAPDSAQARRAREVAVRQLSHLTRLVDDLLDVTRIARNKIGLRRTDLDLAALVRRTSEDHRSVLEGHGLELRIDVPAGALPFQGDETRLAQVLGNLLQNAAKFTPVGGRVDVELEVRRPEGVAELRVRDTGEGMEPALLAHAFEPFVQAQQSIARSGGGLGLGLALVKGVVELHGGTVAAASDGPGRGTEVTLRLPLAGAGAGEARSDGRSS